MKSGFHSLLRWFWGAYLGCALLFSCQHEIGIDKKMELYMLGYYDGVLNGLNRESNWKTQFKKDSIATRSFLLKK